LRYNDFVIVGPKSDPAHIASDKNVVAALKKIAAAKAPFVLREQDASQDEAGCGLLGQSSFKELKRRT
jgi:tungstate transport system substrate-binding protein